MENKNVANERSVFAMSTTLSDKVLVRKKYLYYYMMTDAGLVSLSKVRKSSFSKSNIGLIIDITGPWFDFY